MIFINSNLGTFTAVLQAYNGEVEEGVATCDLYEASKSIVELSLNPLQTAQMVAYNVTDGAGGWTYVSDSNGRLVLPLEKWVKRAAAGDGSLSIGIGIDGTEDYIVIQCQQVKKGVAYEDIVAPVRKEMDGFSGGYSVNMVAPPNVIVNPSNGNGIRIETNFGAPAVWSDGTDEIELTGDRLNTLEVGSLMEQLVVEDDKGGKRVWLYDKPSFSNCDGNIVCVRWTSQTGCVRQHYFYYAEIDKATDESVSLISEGDGYKVLKNASNGVTIRIEGLTAYGVWYYNDLLQASDVHAVFGSYASGLFLPAITSEQSCVFFEGDGVTPEGSGFFTFSAKLKFSHYDTIQR